MRHPMGPAILLVFALVAVFMTLTGPASASTRIGGTLTINGPIDDVQAFGGVVTVNGPVAGDVTVVGGTVTVTGPVTDSVSLVGGNLTVNARVMKTLSVAGGKVTISAGSRIMGDMSIAAGEVDLSGRMNGRVAVAGASVTVNGRIQGSAEIAAANVSIGPDAVFGGDLTIQAPEEPVIPDSVVIKGTYTFEQDASGGLFSLPSISVELDRLTWTEASLLAGITLIFILFLIYVFPRFNDRVLRTLSNRPMGSVMTGAVLIVLMPIVSALLCATVIGLLIGIPALLFYPIMVVLGLIYGIIGLTRWLLRRAGAGPSPFLFGLSLLVMLIFVTYLSTIDIVGPLAVILLTLFGTGAVGSVLLYGERACVADPNPPRESWRR